MDQKGSLVDPEKTRFDFSHRKAVSVEELVAIEEKSNQKIRENLEVHTNDNEPVPYEDAIKINGLRAVFGEKYPSKVRVVSIGVPVAELLRNAENAEWMKYSVEFCGGTHLKRTGQAERFRIIEETSVARGIRRITAVTGERAKKCDENARMLLSECERIAALPEAELEERVADFGRRVNDEDLPYLARLALREKLAELQSRVKKYAKKQAGSSAKDVRAVAEGLLAEAESVGASKVLVGEMPSAGPEQIREAIDYLRTEAGSAGICLGCVNGEKVLLFAAFTDDLVGKGLKAGDLIKAVAPAVGGGGGGKPELAQAGGKNPAGLPKALDMARDWLTAHLQP